MAQGKTQNHSCCPKKAGVGTRHIVVQDCLHVGPCCPDISRGVFNALQCTLLLHWLLSEHKFEQQKHDVPSSHSNCPRC